MPRIPLVVIVLVLSAAFAGARPAAAPRAAKILVIYGARSDDPLHRQAAATLRRVLAASGVAAAISEEFVDESRLVPRNGGRPQSATGRDDGSDLAAKYRDSTP